MKLIIGASLLALGIADATVTSAQSAQNKVQWNLRLNETRGPIRAPDVSPLAQGASSEILGGEAIAPATSRDLLAMMTPAQPSKVENGARYIRRIAVPPAKDLKPGLNGQVFTNRAMGSANTVRLDSTMPGSGGPATHVHRFEQVYFFVEGSTTIVYGADKRKASKNDIVILAPAVVHTNVNESGAPERHLTLLLPQPEDGAPADIEFEMKAPGGGML